MILEAFSQTLTQSFESGHSPETILHHWLLDILNEPLGPGDHVSRVIHTEIGVIEDDQALVFVGRSKTGEKLLNSLYEYCKSYEHWQFCRWLHTLQASDFATS